MSVTYLRSSLLVAVLVTAGAGFANANSTQNVPSIHDRVQAYMAQSQQDAKQPGAPKFSEQDMATMQAAAEKLAKDMPEPGLKVGDKAPDFSLPNAFGKQVRLSDYLKKGPVILAFYRGAWCPFCNIQLHALHESMPQFKQYNANLIMVTLQTPDKSLDQIKKDKYTFQVLSDLDSSVIKKYKLYFELPADLIAVYKKLGLDIEVFNGKGRNELPVPGTYIIDTSGVIRAANADTDYKKRMEPQAIIDALKKIQ